MQIAETEEASIASQAVDDKPSRTHDLEAASVTVRTRKIRVLVVEDNPSDSELMLHALKKGCFETEFELVQTAAEFADRIRKNRYDIILADYRSRDGTGWRP